jgi:hypothetical protein
MNGPAKVSFSGVEPKTPALLEQCPTDPTGAMIKACGHDPGRLRVRGAQTENYPPVAMLDATPEFGPLHQPVLLDPLGAEDLRLPAGGLGTEIKRWHVTVWLTDPFDLGDIMPGGPAAAGGKTPQTGRGIPTGVECATIRST